MSSATAPNDSDDTVRSEQERIFDWRCEQLCRAGYSREAAILLAAYTEVDLHRAIELRAGSLRAA
jgi:hypothetical protein